MEVEEAGSQSLLLLEVLTEEGSQLLEEDEEKLGSPDEAELEVLVLVLVLTPVVLASE